jgi:hypothetical protein
MASRYGSRQWALAAAVAALLVVVCVVALPWWSVTVRVGGLPGLGTGIANTESVSGTHSPFLGVADLVLAFGAGIVALLYALGMVSAGTGRGPIVLCAVLFLAVAVTAVVDATRDMGGVAISTPLAGAEGGKGVGAVATLLCAAAGAFCAFRAYRSDRAGPPAAAP